MAHEFERKKNSKRRCRKIAACMVRNKILIIIILGEKEVGVRHTWWERGSLFSLLAGAPLFALGSHSSQVVHMPCSAGQKYWKSKINIFNKIGLAWIYRKKNNLTCYSKSLLSSSTPPWLVPVLLRDSCDPREPWELKRLSEVWEPLFTTSSREGGCAGWRSFWNACIEELRGNF